LSTRIGAVGIIAPGGCLLLDYQDHLFPARIAKGGHMTPPVVTLFEKYGAGARYIGPRVAKALGVEWMDQAFSSADIESAKYPGGGKAGDQGSGLARS
jgi:hypothetical protein